MQIWLGLSGVLNLRLRENLGVKRCCGIGMIMAAPATTTSNCLALSVLVESIVTQFIGSIGIQMVVHVENIIVERVMYSGAMAHESKHQIRRGYDQNA